MINNHWLSFANRVPSRNFNNRSSDNISLIVVHSISLPPGIYGNHFIEAFFTNKLDISQDPYFDEISGLEVSAHLLIKRSGDVVQFVPFDKRAWHAGESSYKGESDCNNFSIGIELEGTDTDEFEDRQYEILSEIIKVLKSSYAIEAVVGHSDIAPGRKTDPGSGFNWNRINELI